MTIKQQQKLIQKYLAGKASPEEIKQVDAWYNAFENDNPVSSLVSKELAERSKEEILSKVTRRNQPSPSFYKYAAILAAVVFIALLTLKPFEKNANLITINTYGKKDTTFSTPDHSIIWLKANSELSYDVNNFGKHGRTVVIHKGEAYFEVKRNPSSPFTVEYNRTAIHVLGTGFNVFTDSKKGSFNVMVSHGLVEVTHCNRRLSYLKKGDAINLNTKTNTFDTTHFNPKYAAAWRNEEISLKEVSFEELSDVFYSLYRIRLQSAHDNASGKYTYTLDIHKNDDYLTAIMIIASIHQNKYKVENDTILIY